MERCQRHLDLRPSIEHPIKSFSCFWEIRPERFYNGQIISAKQFGQPIEFGDRLLTKNRLADELQTPPLVWLRRWSKLRKNSPPVQDEAQ